MNLFSASQRSPSILLKALPLISFLFFYACTPVAPVGEPTQTPPGAEIFSTTSAVANTPIPSQGPTSEPLPMFSLPTRLASLPTLTPLSPPTTVVRTPFPTATLSVPTLGPGTPETECFVTASKEGIQLELGPFISRYKLLPKMEPGVIYQAIDIHPTFYQLAWDGVPVGWVEYILIGLSGEGSGCARLFARPPDTRSLTDFPGLCLFTVNRPTQSFQDSALTEPHFMGVSSSDPYPFVVMWKSQKSIFTCLSHAGPCFYVPTDTVSIFGNCAGIPTSATVTTAGWLWSMPDERQGEKLMRLTVGLRLHIEGNRPPDSSGEGAWVQAVVENQSESVSGSVWSALLSFD